MSTYIRFVVPDTMMEILDKNSDLAGLSMSSLFSTLCSPVRTLLIYRIVSQVYLILYNLAFFYLLFETVFQFFLHSRDMTYIFKHRCDDSRNKFTMQNMSL